MHASRLTVVNCEAKKQHARASSGLRDHYSQDSAVVSREAKKKQHARASSGLRDHYSELFTRMAALKFENAVTQPP